MTRIHDVFARTFALLMSACVADIELDTDGQGNGDSSSDAGAATANPTEDGAGGGDGLGTEGATSETDGMVPPQEDPGPVDVDPAVEPLAWGRAVAEARCAALQRCDCNLPDSRWSDLDVCIQDLEELYQERAEWAQSAGATISASCFSVLNAVLLDGSCEPTVPPLSSAPAVAAQFCKLFEGTGQQGDACASGPNPILPDDTCAANLECVNGGCEAVIAPGDPCSDANTAQCLTPLSCVEGSCGELRALGESCTTLAECDTGMLCERGTCVAALEPDDPCEHGYECVSQTCVDGLCAPARPLLCGPYGFEVEIE